MRRLTGFVTAAGDRGGASPRAAAHRRPRRRPATTPAAAGGRRRRRRPPPPAAQPPAAAPAQPPAAQPDGAPAAAAPARARRRPRHSAAAATAAAGGDAEAGRADRLGDRADTGSARRPEGRPVGRRPGRVEHAHDLDDAAEREGRCGATHSDLAFTGNYAIQGNYNGFEIFDISNPAKPVLVQTYVCPASQNDVSVYRTCSSCRRKRPTAAPTAASAACPSRSARSACAASASSTSPTSRIRSS